MTVAWRSSELDSASFKDRIDGLRLFQRLEGFVEAVIATKVVTSLLVDGSFVTAKQEPGDIDLVIVVGPDHDFGMLRRPFEYNVLSKRRVKRRYGFDVLVAREGSMALAEYTAFFQQVRGEPGVRKGILRLGVSP